MNKKKKEKTVKEKLNNNEYLSFSDMHKCYKQYRMGVITLSQYRKIMDKHQENKRNSVDRKQTSLVK
jgi:hypothetical protein